LCIFFILNKKYKAKLVKRVNIPKGNGKFRPLGLPALRDKIVQKAVANILEAIYEQDFLDNSCGVPATNFTVTVGLLVTQQPPHRIPACGITAPGSSNILASVI